MKSTTNRHPIPITDEDIVQGMGLLTGYIDITINDFRELYETIYTLAKNNIVQKLSVLAIMQSPALCMLESKSTQDAIVFLGTHKISGAPVVDKNGALVGIISEKDILRRFELPNMTRSIQILAYENSLSLPSIQKIKSTPIRDIMTTSTIYVTENSVLAHVLDIFTNQQINRVPVVDTMNVPVGIITRNDIIQTFSILLS